MKDDVKKIFITTKSPNKDNLSEDFLALLKYIDGNITDNSFVNELENKIHKKKDEKERGAYMQYDLHLMQIEEEARAEGKLEALLETAKRIIKKGIYTLEEIAENLNLPFNEVQTISAQMATSMS